MANIPSFGTSVSGWDPGAGMAASDKRVNQLMSTEAMDAPDTISATNKLEAFRGKSGTPPAPYGIKGTDF